VIAYRKQSAALEVRAVYELVDWSIRTPHLKATSTVAHRTTSSRRGPPMRLEGGMTLPGPEAAHHWQGRTLVDRSGEPVGSIERIYKDKATDQPEWALLAAGVAGPGATFVPLVNATEEGEIVRTPFDRALFERAPSVPVGPEITEDQEAELYRHYGVAYSRAGSPSGLPTDQPRPTAAQPAGETQPPPAMEPTITPAPAAGPAPTRLDAVPSQPAGEAVAPAGGAKSRISDPRVAAAAGGAALAVAAGIWQRKRIGRQVGAAASGLAGVPASMTRRRRERRRVKAFDQAVARVTDRATALGRSASRLLATLGLIPVAGAVQAGRRGWAGAQAAGQGIGQLAGRARPGARKPSRAKRAAKVVAGTAVVSRIATIPKRVSRRRQGRRGATAAKRSLLRGAGQAAMVGSTVGRLLAGAALLPVTSAARGSRRALASVQVTRPGGKGGGGGRRRRGSRGKVQLGTLGAILGGAAGYVLGARAGEDRYQEMLQSAKRLTQRPEVQRASDQAAAKLDQLGSRAADKLQQARRQAPAEPASRPSEPATATQAPPERLP
jgi:hypothetical protein